MPHLLDTNLLVYTHDDAEPTKATRARQVISTLGRYKTGVLSTQNLSGFSNVMLRKYKFSPEELYTVIIGFEKLFNVFPLTPIIVLEAIRGVQTYSFSYYDAQLWAVAKLNQIPSLLSEDFATGSSIEGVTFQNPLAQNFDLTLLEA